MEKIRSFILTVPLALNIAFILTVIITIIKITYLDNLTAPFRGADTLSTYADGILASIIASYIFYLIVVHISDYKAQVSVKPIITKICQRIVFNCKFQVESIAYHANMNFNFENVTENNLYIVFQDLNLYEKKAPQICALTKETASWLLFFQYNTSKTLDAIDESLKIIKYLDAELVEDIFKISNSSFVGNMKNSMQIPNLDFDRIYLTKIFFEYVTECRKLINR